MKKERILLILGVLITLSPFYGLPGKGMTVITILLGVLVILLSLRRSSALESPVPSVPSNGE